MSKHELIVSKIEKRTNSLREVGTTRNLFPLSPTHRKELRQLKRDNCRQLQSRLQTIRSMKKAEFIKKYESKISKEISKQEKQYKEKIKIIESKNNELQKSFKIISKIYEEHKEDSVKIINDETGDKEFNPKSLSDELFRITDSNNLYYLYGYINKVNENNLPKLSYLFASESLKNKILDKQFKEQFGEQFSQCSKMIESLEQQYQEAINFGDLDQVKSIYYYMKDSEKFFEQVSELKV